MTILNDLLDTVARGADPGPFALLRRDENPDRIEVLTGAVTVADRLADIPLPPGSTPGTAGLPRPAGPATLAVVPFRQVTERGFACVDDGAPLECLRIAATATVPLADALAALPDAPVAASGGGFDLDDRTYADLVAAVLRDEIGRGEGANFVISRRYEATVDGDPLAAALTAFGRLLRRERGAYWTFLVHTVADRSGSARLTPRRDPETAGRTLVGATPERHVSVADGLVMMNPISGTHRHGPAGPDVEDLLRFLADPKEIDELYMVLDEELKMMATVAERGGQVVGPYLKEMAHLTHTEYLLAGRGSRDVRDVLRETMFAPTVTGSPIENACRVIARHERRGRGYYAGVLALLGYDDAGRQTLDAPILIRTAEILPDGRLRVPVGATLVRHSSAAGEVAETAAKAAGILDALGLRDAPGSAPAAPGDRPAGGRPGPRWADDPRVRTALAARNDRLARFWLDERTGAEAEAALAGRTVTVVDAEDTFTGMLAHQLRALGMTVTVLPYTDLAPPGPVPAGSAPPGLTALDADLVVAGPGPGDPEDPADVRMAVLRAVVADRLSAGRPLLGVCLGHQVLAGALGLRLHRRPAPYQGLQRTVDVFGRIRRVGFYSTFTPVSDVDFLRTPYGVAALACDPEDGAVHALRGPAFAGVQFHPESVLSPDGLDVLRELITAVFVPVGARD
jgi:phenazine biosynthesis protein phzE